MAGRTDRASRLIKAVPGMIYSAFVDPKALVSWLPPSGMTGRIDHFDPRPGGRYRMTLIYNSPDYSAAGKSSDNADIVEGEFVRLVQDREVVQRAEFQSDDPAFAGAMTISWKLEPTNGGTEVTIVCENVPVGISAEDHAAGLASSLENLAAYCEKDPR